MRLIGFHAISNYRLAVNVYKLAGNILSVSTGFSARQYYRNVFIAKSGTRVRIFFNIIRRAISRNKRLGGGIKHLCKTEQLFLRNVILARFYLGNG